LTANKKVYYNYICDAITSDPKEKELLLTGRLMGMGIPVGTLRKLNTLNKVTTYFNLLREIAEGFFVQKNP
jgi:hypothetical protein